VKSDESSGASLVIAGVRPLSAIADRLAMPN
jgi:hypothetical protein